MGLGYVPLPEFKILEGSATVALSVGAFGADGLGRLRRRGLVGGADGAGCGECGRVWREWDKLWRIFSKTVQFAGILLGNNHLKMVQDGPRGRGMV